MNPYPWPQAPAWARMAATDANGFAFWYDTVPELRATHWFARGRSERMDIDFASSDQWKQSCMSRPDAPVLSGSPTVGDPLTPGVVAATSQALAEQIARLHRGETLQVMPGTLDAVDPAALLLDQAKKIITGARRQTYGKPEENFQVIAELWTAYLKKARANQEPGQPRPYVIHAHDVSAFMVLMKCARLAETPAHADSWRDIAGYAACGARASGADLS